jgi:hypothetical protein
LGAPQEHSLISDKHETALRLAAAGLAAPPLLALLKQGSLVSLDQPFWMESGSVFAKPRRGSASRGVMAIEVTGSGLYRVNGDVVERGRLEELLTVASRADDYLIQRRLLVTRELAEFASDGSAPVLRLTTARLPGGKPMLHSALLAINVQGENPRDFIRGQVRAPVNVSTGALCPGVWFLEPSKRYASLPWNDAQLVDRLVPHFFEAAEGTLRAMSLFPALALINWDLILTDSGPVILEGNTCGDWILTNLSMTVGLTTQPLAPIFRRWATESGMA